MTDKPSTVLTFHQLRAQCETPAADAWRSFLGWYSAPFVHLLRMYGRDESAWEQTLEALARDDFAKLKAMPRQSEREFLLALRDQVLDRVLENASAAGAGEQGPEISVERMTTLLDGLPLLHQEMVWMKLAGYTDATTEAVLRVSPSVGRAALDRLDPDFSAVRAAADDRCLWPERWIGFLRQAREKGGKDCPPLHQLLRIQDGQVSWYDKEPMEKRVAGCLHCLETWTGLHELGYWRRAAPALPPGTTERFLQRIPVEERKKSLLQRVFGD